MPTEHKDKNKLTTLSQILQQIADLTQRENQLKLQEEQICVFPEQRNALISRYSQVETYRDLYEESFESLQKIWQRLWSEPQDPMVLIERYHHPTITQISSQIDELCDKLEDLLQMHVRAIKSWQKLVDEARYRQHLLGGLEQQMLSLEQQITDHNQAQEQLQRAEDIAKSEQIWRKASQVDPDRDDQLIAQLEHADQSKADERRQHTRLEVGMVIQFGEKEHSFYTGFSENISSGGLFIATFDLLPNIGERFTLSFSLPTGRKIEAESEVAWLREYSIHDPNISPGFGCRFINLSPEDAEDINKYIAKEGSLFMLESADI